MQKIRVFFTTYFILFGFSVIALADESAGVISYELTPMPAEAKPKIKIAVRFKGEKSGTTRIQLPMRFAGQEELFRGVKNLNLLTAGAKISDSDQPNIKIISHEPKREIKLEYDLLQDWDGEPQAAGNPSDSAGSGYRPILQKDYFHFLGSGGFVLPDLPESAKVKVSIVWKNIPDGWSWANSFGARELKQKFNSDVESFLSSVFVGGDFQIKEKRVKGKSVLTALRGKWKFTNDEFAGLVEKIVTIERDFWRDNEPYFLVTLLPLGDDGRSLSIGGTGLTNSFATFVTQNASLENLAFLIAHEYFHNWNSRKLGGLQDPERLLYWFSEGFTDYYTYLFLLRGGFLDLEKYAAKYNEFLTDYYSSPVRNESNQRILQDFFKVYEVGKLPYRRGMFLAAKWNKIIREQTNGAKSLDDVMREIFRDAKTGKYEKLSKARIIAYFSKYAKHNFAADVEKYIEKGETIGIFDGVLGQCVNLVETQISKFELGFDLETSAKEKRIAGVIKDSAAYDAGLRDGQKALGYSVYYGNVNKEAEIYIEENSGKKKISYLPLAKAKILIPQFVLKENLSDLARRVRRWQFRPV